VWRWYAGEILWWLVKPCEVADVNFVSRDNVDYQEGSYLPLVEDLNIKISGAL
jgi:hypothetical protein